MKKLYIKFKKLLRKSFIPLTICVILLFSLSVPVSAVVTHTYSIPISKPNVDGYTSYIEIVYNNFQSAEVCILNCRNIVDNSSAPIILDVYDDHIIASTIDEAHISYFSCTSYGGTYYNSSLSGEIYLGYSGGINGIYVYGVERCVFQSDVSVYGDFAIAYGTDDIYLKHFEFIENYIKDNQQEILNGWENKNTEEDINTEIGSSIGNHNDLENKIEADSQVGVNDAKGLFSNFSLNRGNIGSGLLAITNIFTNLFNIGFTNDLLQYGLVIGLFGFVIGTAQLLIRGKK